MQKFILLTMMFLVVMLIAACANTTVDTVAESHVAPEIHTNSEATTMPDTLTPYQMQYNPRSFQGTIYVEGIVTEHNRLPFALISEDSDFVLGIDYRGNQALPEVGSVVVASGTVGHRPCCGYFLNSIHFSEE